MENNIKQTAVDWFSEQVFQLFNLLQTGNISINDFRNRMTYIEYQAKEIEKHQIIDACWAGGDDGERYFNEIYGGNK